MHGYMVMQTHNLLGIHMHDHVGITCIMIAIVMYKYGRIRKNIGMTTCLQA